MANSKKLNRKSKAQTALRKLQDEAIAKGDYAGLERVTRAAHATQKGTK